MENIADTDVAVKFRLLTDVHGIQALVPAATIEAFRQMGRGSLSLEFHLPKPPDRHWITLADAIRQHVTDVTPGRDPEQAARKRITKAIEAGLIPTNGQPGRELRLDLIAFKAWRLDQREAELDRDG